MEYQVREEIILKNICGTWLLIAVGDASKHCLYIREINEVFAWYWERISKNIPAEKIIQEACSVYDASENLIRTDLMELYKNLVKMGYLIEKDGVES